MVNFGFSGSFAAYIPVRSDPVNTTRTEKQRDVPACGGRWGRPGSFGFSASGSLGENALANPVFQQLMGQIENDPNKQPTKITKYFAAGVDLFLTGKTKRGRHDFEPSRPDGLAIFETLTFSAMVCEGIAFQWSEMLPKPHVYSQNPIRRWKYALTFMSRPPGILSGYEDPDEEIAQQILDANPGGQATYTPMLEADINT